MKKQNQKEDNMKENKNYWTNRVKKKGFFSSLKRYYFFQVLFSCRAGDELYLRTLFDKKNDKVLDVACGGGKQALVDNTLLCDGIDIKGYPKEIAQLRGYKETYEWEEDYSIPTDKKYDAITIINLNAHVSFDSLNKMLNSIKNNCKSNGKIVFINEFDNDNFMYRYMKKNKKSFDKYVHGCKHYYFTDATLFEKHMKKVSWMSLKSTKVISANPPFSHLLAVVGINVNDNYFYRGISLIADIFISQINNLSTSNSGFIVGYIYTVNNEANK